jgi:hypothetical protein
MTANIEAAAHMSTDPELAFDTDFQTDLEFQANRERLP